MKSEQIASKRVVWSIFILTIILVLALTFIIKNFSFGGSVGEDTSSTSIFNIGFDNSSVDENSQSQDESEDFSSNLFDFSDPITLMIWAALGYLITQILFGRRRR